VSSSGWHSLIRVGTAGLARHGVVVVGVALAGRSCIDDFGEWAVVVGAVTGFYVPVGFGD